MDLIQRTQVSEFGRFLSAVLDDGWVDEELRKAWVVWGQTDGGKPIAEDWRECPAYVITKRRCYGSGSMVWHPVAYVKSVNSTTKVISTDLDTPELLQ